MQRKNNIMTRHLYEAQLYSNAITVMLFSLINLFVQRISKTACVVSSAICSTLFLVETVSQFLVAMAPITLNKKYAIMQYYEVCNTAFLVLCPAVTIYAIYILDTDNAVYGILILVENAIVQCWI